MNTTKSQDGEGIYSESQPKIVLADSHAHLDFPDFSSDLEEVMQRAEKAGVIFINTISTRLTQIESLLKICERFPHVFASVGIHPHYAGQVEESSIEAIVTAGNHKKIVAVGETGLDFHYDLSERSIQETVFRNHIQAAKVLNLPLIIHTREAESATKTILEEEGLPSQGGVLHCFTGSQAMAEWGVDKGLYISLSGVITFKNGTALREVARHIPLDRLLIETDAPYLSPVPYRGKRNEPAFVVQMAETLAELHGLSLEKMAAITTENYVRLFHKEQKITSKIKPILAYAIGDGLYINISRGCTLRCSFCPKWEAPIVHDYDLSLEHNPSAAEILQDMGDFSSYKEIVFCGYGEPTLRLETLLEVAQAVKRQKNISIRINTDGLANRVYRKDITPRFQGLIDAVSVSLNAQDEETYNRHCLPSLRGSYPSVVAFLRAVQLYVPEVTATAIEGLEGVDIAACQTIAKQLGVQFRKRTLNRVG